MADALTEYLDAWASQLSIDLQKSLASKTRSKNKNTRLGASIEPFHKQGYDNYTVGIKINDYYVFVDGGRKPGNVAQSVNIRDWAKRKGIDPRKKIEEAREAYRKKNVKKPRVKTLKKMSYDAAMRSFEYVVKRKLTSKGYDGNEFYSEVVTQAKLDALQKTVSELFQKQVNIELQ